MQLKTILNRVQKHPSFVYQTVRLVEHPRQSIEVRVRPRAGTRAKCSQCRRRAPGYDTLPVRRFDFVPLWHIPVVFLYAMRRVSCPRCGVRVEALPWATGKHRLTDAYAWFLAGWAKRLSWQEVAAAFPTSWDTVHRAVRMAVDWGLAHRVPDPHRGHRRRRALAPPRATLPDVGLSDRRPLQAPAAGRTRTQGRDPGGFLRLVRRRTKRRALLRLLGHVEALPEGGRRARRAGGAGARPLPHHEPLLQGDRRSARGRGPQARRRGPGAAAQAQPLAPAQASGESHRRAGRTPCRAGASQPAHGSRLPAQGGLSIAVGLRVAVLGGAVPRPLVHPDDALAARTDEGCCPHGALAPRPDPELVPSPGASSPVALSKASTARPE